MVEVPVRATHVDHPFRPGVRADVSDVDQPANLLESIQAEMLQIRACEGLLRSALGELANQNVKGEKKTRRVQGRGCTAVVTMPDDKWSQPTLKECVVEFPDFQEQYIRVATYAVNMREVRKLDEMNGDEAFLRFKAKLLSARSEGTSPPQVKVERPKPATKTN